MIWVVNCSVPVPNPHHARENKLKKKMYKFRSVAFRFYTMRIQERSGSNTGQLSGSLVLDGGLLEDCLRLLPQDRVVLQQRGQRLIVSHQGDLRIIYSSKNVENSLKSNCIT